MHIVLSGYFGYDNVGDEAILFSIIRALRKLEPTVEITVLSNNPAETAATYGVNSVNRWNFGEIRSAFKKADGLISGGGSLMQDATSTKTIPYYAGIIKLAQMAKVPVFIYSQGMGPINGKLGKWLVKSVFNKSAGITVRDEDSSTLLRDIGVRLPVTVVPDPVVGLGGNEFTSPWLDEWLKTQFKADAEQTELEEDVASLSASASVGKPDADMTTMANDTMNGKDAATDDMQVSVTPPAYITVSVRDWPSEVDFKKKIAESLDLIATQELHIVFIPMHGEHDVKASADVAALMQSTSTIAPGDLSIEEKIAVIGGSKLLIGQRLHSLIFAGIEHIPFIALSYDPKIDAFANIAQQPVAGHVEKDDWTGQTLAELAFDILDDYEAKVATLIDIITPMQTAAENTAQMALDAFTK
jgi:polysaccharide pyruvyl transferase CsaB